MSRAINSILTKSVYVGAGVSTLGMIVAGGGVGLNMDTVRNIGIFTTCIGLGILNTTKVIGRLIKNPIDDLESQISNSPVPVTQEPIHDNVLPRSQLLRLRNGEALQASTLNETIIEGAAV